jgi:Leucine-rich repeat (LRR) protein
MISLEKWFEIEENVISQVKTLDFSNKEITEIPSLKKYKNLTRLNCNNNLLTKIPELPDNLKFLDVRNNQIERLPSRLPRNLRSFNCANNRIRKIPEVLPPYLKIFICNNNKIKIIPPLDHSRLLRFECMRNNIHYLQHLPASLLVLNYDALQMREDPFLIGQLQKKIWVNGFCIQTDKCRESDDFSIYFSESEKSNDSYYISEEEDFDI